MPTTGLRSRGGVFLGIVGCALLTCSRSVEAAPPDCLIGFTQLQTNLPGGRHANVRTMRAVLVKPDGSGRRLVAGGLARDLDTWTQFAGWSPDGRIAIVGRGWQSPENAKWEDEHKQFRFTKDGWLYDVHLVDTASGKATNVTAVERVSFYNSGLFFWPGDATKLGFTALVDGNSHPFRMDRDGRNKRDLTKESKEFAYGFNPSRDGKCIAYHKSYQVYVADANGSNARQIKIDRPFNSGRSGRRTVPGCSSCVASRIIATPTLSDPTAPGWGSWPTAGATRARSIFSTCPNSTAAAAMSRSGPPMASRCSTRREQPRAWNCFA